MKIIAGLGNPGPEYVLFKAQRGMARGGSPCEPVFLRFPEDAVLVHGLDPFPERGKLLLLKPLTYMNLSGRAVREAADYFSPPGKTTFWWCTTTWPFPTGSSGCGRKAPREATRECCPSSGGGNPGGLQAAGRRGSSPGENMVSWVLGAFSGNERSELPGLLDRAADAVELWCTEGADKAMNTINATV